MSSSGNTATGASAACRNEEQAFYQRSLPERAGRSLLLGAVATSGLHRSHGGGGDCGRYREITVQASVAIPSSSRERGDGWETGSRHVLPGQSAPRPGSSSDAGSCPVHAALPV